MMVDGRSRMPRRTIHLDFHTAPEIPDVGAQFDPEDFAGTFAAADVDSVTVFAKCHHGHLYYLTDRAERHPNLKSGLDLLGSQIEALHTQGIRAPIYISVQCDEYAANTHPEWIALHEDLRQVKRATSVFEAGWQILDMSSPYQEYLAEQVAEVLARFAPVDGIFLDMCWDQPSASKWAIDGARKAGLDPRDPEHRARYARQNAHAYMQRFRDMIVPSLAEDTAMGVWFNSRPRTSLAEEKQYLRHVEIEALPTGGWGYSYLPYVARFTRPLGLPGISQTGRFHFSWGDNGALKPAAALKYECCQILSHGFSSGVGDLLHPSGRINHATYRLIGNVYSHIKKCEPFVAGGENLDEVALVVDPELGDNPGPAVLGAVRALQQLRQQFDVIAPDADLSPYRVLILPETTQADERLQSALREFANGGGGLIVSGPAALNEAGQPILDELGIEVHGPSPYTHVFLHPLGQLARATEPFDTVVYERGFRMTARDGAEVLCGVIEPYFERTYEHFSGHSYTPPRTTESQYAAAVRNGRVITWALPVLQSFGLHANVPYRELLGCCLDLLLPDPLLRVGGPVHLETSVVRADDSTAVHLLSFLPSRQAENLDLVHDPFPLLDVPVSVRLDNPPQSATLQPSGQELELTYDNGYAHTAVTVTDGHALVVFS
jgi:Hypothetical glycosyl hydrolase 6/Beta-galactosidase trimerisation domain